LEREWFVYALYAGKQVKPCYVGIAKTDKRMQRHIGDARRGYTTSNLRKSLTLIACVRRGISLVPRKIAWNLTVNEAGAMERGMIAHYGRRGIVPGGCLLNKADGGAGHTGHKPSKEQSEAQAARNKDPVKISKIRKTLEDPVARISCGNGSRGRKQTEEEKIRRSLANKGRSKPPRTERHKLNLVLANRRNAERAKVAKAALTVEER
jgi:hypothetical protein